MLQNYFIKTNLSHAAACLLNGTWAGRLRCLAQSSIDSHRPQLRSQHTTVVLALSQRAAMLATELTCLQRGATPGRDWLPPALPCRTLSAPRPDRPGGSPRRTLHQPQHSRCLLRAADNDLQGADAQGRGAPPPFPALLMTLPSKQQPI